MKYLKTCLISFIVIIICISVLSRNNIIISFIISLVLIIINICFSKISYKLFIYLTIIISSNLLGSFIFIKRKKRS